MSTDEKEDTTIYRVVINHEEQYSIWPTYLENPLGRKDAGKSGNKEECLAFVKEVWTDMCPLSLRKKWRKLRATRPTARPSSTSTAKQLLFLYMGIVRSSFVFYLSGSANGPKLSDGLTSRAVCYLEMLTAWAGILPFPSQRGNVARRHSLFSTHVHVFLEYTFTWEQPVLPVEPGEFPGVPFLKSTQRIDHDF